MPNLFGVGLANGPQDMQRLLRLGCDHYLGLGDQADQLLQCPGERYLRLLDGDFLTAPVNTLVSRYVAWRKRGIRHLIPWNEGNQMPELGWPAQKQDDGPTLDAAYREVAARYGALLDAVNGLDIVLHFPGWSPNFGYREHSPLWLAAAMRAPVVDIHVYGTAAQMLEIVDWYIANLPGKDIFISEWNFGAGNHVDEQWWAGEAVRFMAALESRPQVIAACGFIWQWYHPDSALKTSVDWLGHPIEGAIAAAPKPARSTKMPDYPSAEWHPSPNFGYGRGTHGRNGQSVVAIVEHITAGPFTAADGWFLNPSSSVSAHYTVKKDGGVVQYVDEQDAAWACGLDTSKGVDYYRSDLGVPWIAALYRDGVNPNLRSVSVEHESAGETLNSAQLQASIALNAYLAKKYNLPADRNHFVGHYQVNLRDRPLCPGPNFPWHDLMAGLALALGGNQPQPSPVPAPIPGFELVDQYRWRCTYTGVIAAFRVLQIYKEANGLYWLGYPRRDWAMENGRLVYWTQRARIEVKPQYVDANGVVNPNVPWYEIFELGLLGDEVLHARGDL